MAAKKHFTLDFTDFNRGFATLINKTIPAHAEKGLFFAGALLIRYAITEEPMVPHKTGHLKRSQLIEPIKDDARYIGVRIGFNTSYAAKVHEAPSSWNWSLPGSGPKFLESKLATHKDEVPEKVAEYIRKQGKTI